MKECIVCHKEKETINIHLCEENGFCSYSHGEEICHDCLKENSKITSVGTFLKIDGRLFYDEYGFGGYDSIDTKYQLDRIFNREYYDVLKFLNA